LIRRTEVKLSSSVSKTSDSAYTVSLLRQVDFLL